MGEEVDVEDWRRHTTYSGGYSNKSKMIGWWWQIVRSYSNEQRQRLLQYVTGTCNVPSCGFQGLQGRDGNVKLFEIRKVDADSTQGNLASHTCFNRLHLPPCSTRRELELKLSLTIKHCTSGFTEE